MKGLVSRIQRFSAGDGPGIRSTVFLKGCNLSCVWCHNPELMARENELRFTDSNCADCRTCVAVCPNGAWSVDAAGRRVHDAGRCQVCGTCAERCPYDALGLVARWTEPGEALEVLLRDRAYYDRSGGGITASGGEPLLQAEFVGELFTGARVRKVHTALDTAACVSWRIVEPLLAVTDLFLVDLKSIDPEVHRRTTGARNDLVLDNLMRLSRAGAELVVRMPVVPGLNDAEADVRAAADFLARLPRLRGVELLPYHDLGVGKMKVLQRPGEAQQRFPTPEPARMQRLATLFRDRGVAVLER